MGLQCSCIAIIFISKLFPKTDLKSANFFQKKKLFELISESKWASRFK